LAACARAALVVLDATVDVTFQTQASAAPVVQMSAAGVTLHADRKMSAMAVLTRELFQYTESAETLIPATIRRKFAKGIDAVLFDNTAASGTRPAGLRSGISAVTPSASTNLQEAFIADIAALGASVADVTTNLCYIMSPKQWLSFQLRKPSGFAIPALPSAAVTDKTICCIGVDAFVVAGSGEPVTSVSKNATAVRRCRTDFSRWYAQHG
jgi:hypothetical protein